MFIQTETTPNPLTLKFLPGRTVADKGTELLPADAARSPLATRIFALDGTTGVYFGQDFITVTAKDGAWGELKPRVLGAIMDHFMSGDPILADDAADTVDDDFSDDPADADIVAQIKAILDEKVRPAVARDGGDIAYSGFKEGVVFLKMQGACSGCPSSSATLKFGVENLIKHYVPEVIAVRQI